MRIGFRTALLAAISAVGACEFGAPDYDGTQYACAPPTNACPPGFVCQGGWCTDDPVDASSPQADATPLSGADAAPDAEVITRRFSVAIDTTLRSDTPTTNRGGNDFIETDADPLRVMLMRFDLSSIPPGATVLAASIDAYIFDPIETGAFQLFPLTETWSEGEATYVVRETGVPWSSPGAAGASRDESMLLAELEAREIGLITFILDTDGVQAWVSAPSSNKGLIVVSTSQTGRGGQLRSSEYAIAAERPYLDVTYRAP